jgi:hypothetical protein
MRHVYMWVNLLSVSTHSRRLAHNLVMGHVYVWVNLLSVSTHSRRVAHNLVMEAREHLKWTCNLWACSRIASILVTHGFKTHTLPDPFLSNNLSLRQAPYISLSLQVPFIMVDENSLSASRRRRGDALHLGPRKKPYIFVHFYISVSYTFDPWWLQMPLRSTYFPWPPFWQVRSCTLQRPSPPHQWFHSNESVSRQTSRNV